MAVVEPKKLILCFDGTGNSFSGSNADTNVVKLLAKLDRNHPDQFHYYQTGIGTYDINDETINKSWWGETKSNISMTLDQGFGTTFDAHVLAGYRFLMRCYEPGAKIYMFGFSRGAFTAKFLARMVNTVGLLCKGNEEMVPFAYKLYQRYLQGDIQDRTEAAEEQRHQGKRGGHFFHNQDDHDHDHDHDHEGNAEHNGTSDESAPLLQGANGSVDENTRPGLRGKFRHSKKTVKAFDEITAFSRTFCRNETEFRNGKPVQTNIKVYFLGIWDCVNSVAVLEQKAPIPVPVTGTAHYVRHAVAVDERRVKFKPALLAQDIKHTSKRSATEDIKEVWFPGCHGDVGGGWPCASNEPAADQTPLTLWQRIKKFWRSSKPQGPSRDIEAEPLQMSDVPLYWMMHELELVGKEDPSAAVKWSHSATKFKRLFKKKKQYALNGMYHDSLAFSYGTGFFRVVLWWFMEYLPIITRWELIKDQWVNVRFPLNGGASRDIPRNAVLHESLVWRLQNVKNYRPCNNHGDDLPPCLHTQGIVAKNMFKRINGVSDGEVGAEDFDQDHAEYVFAGSEN
ncbi:Uncharacterized protein ESCO_004930 [Escovopsis weberi]|uniref:T6SS Phospholipase effector Tle1-like catalytic domain-containing protein n=1 Tax=Escovopsis weberi TaxID=150374 RepID=A0A0M8MZ30_ESCWE|nr:Uncharacterized protein ESCO_004930 [Escovopsis weberi]